MASSSPVPGRRRTIPSSDEANPQTGLASVVHVLRINVFPLLRLREMQAVLQTCRATRRLLTSGNHELQSMMRVSWGLLPCRHARVLMHTTA